MAMGVAVDRVDEPFTARLENAGELGVPAPSLDRRENSSFLATIDLLEKRVPVRWGADGKILTQGAASPDEFAKGAWELRKPRVALYQPSLANIDTGWVQWLLDAFRVPHSLLRNADVSKPDWRSGHDTLIFASQGASSILNGSRAGGGRPASPESAPQQRPEYTGGIGAGGWTQVAQFVEQGGTLIAIDAASELPVQKLPLGLKGLLRGGEASPESADEYYCPGSLLRVTVDNTHPVAFGMPKESIVFVSGGQVWDIRNGAARTIVRFAEKDVLASGWLSGEKAIAGKPAVIEVPQGKGRVILFGFRPHFRGQTHGAFKLLLNALYHSSAAPAAQIR
jgi:hypothetical protein